MRKRVLSFLAMILALTLVSSTLVAAQDAETQTNSGTKTAADNSVDKAGNTAVDTAGDSSGESVGDLGELSEEDAQAILQIIMQAAAESGGETAAGSSSSDLIADSIMRSLLEATSGYSTSAGESSGDSSGSSGDSSEAPADMTAAAEDTTEAAGAVSEAATAGTTEDSSVDSSGSSAGDSTGSSAGDSSDSSGEEGEGGLYGKPWVDTVDAGNLQDEVPEAVDDLLVHYTYDILKEHQDGSEYNGIIITPSSNELKNFMKAYINDETNDSHEIRQLRIFYNQAADFDALEKAGLSELQPYLDMVDGAGSVEELNAVLTSGEFPFNPWVELLAGAVAQDREENNHLFIYPRFLFAGISEEENLSNSDDMMIQTIRSSVLLQRMLPVTDVLVALGTPEEKTSSVVMDMLNLEKSYGKYLNPNDVKYQEYGVYADTIHHYTFEELAQISPNFPLTDIIARFGKEKAVGFEMQFPEWITAFNELWTEDNLELLKQITKSKIVMECEYLLDPDIFKVSRAAMKTPDPSPWERAYKACDKLNTFSQVLAKTYVEKCLGQETVDRLTGMSQGLLDTYKNLVESTTWLGEESQQKVLEKLDNMKLNILYPDGGYFNYDNLKLTPTEEGGTLISNYLKLKEYSNLCEIEILDQKARCITSWSVFEPTMPNAFYSEFDNSINIIPGALTSNIYSDDMTDSQILGSIGCCIGHEISHAFDFRGSQMDKYGRPGSIFTEEDVEGFLKICDDLAKYYDTIEYMPGQYIDGKRINAEAAADLSGMQVVLTYAKTLPEYNLEAFFEQNANTYVVVGPQGTASTYVAVDSHPLGYLRTNVNAQMFEDFYEIYGCKEGDGMYLAPENRICFWGK